MITPEHFLQAWVLLLLWTCGQSYAVEENPWETGRTSPVWESVQPQRKLQLTYNRTRSEQENGVLLARAIAALRPGDKLQIGAGRYSVSRKFQIDLRGTSAAPIWIEGQDPTNLPIITRPDARQNVLNIGERSRTEYVCLRNLELTGGSTLIRFYDCHHLWLDQCHLHHAGAEGITANSRDTSHLYITRNHFHDFTNPNATGEAMYLGANHGTVTMSYSVIAHNHVYNCGGKQGDGIEVKQGSHHNWIYRNEVHDTKYPCILVYGTGGNGLNVVEQNTCYRSGDNVMQVQGDALVQNNLLLAGAGAGFTSTDQQGKSVQLVVLHNTIVSGSRGANLTSWNNRKNMVFANNAVYTDGGEALRFPNGSKGVVVQGNVCVGKVLGISQGFVMGNGLDDFTDLAWDGARRDATPSSGGPLIGQADRRYSVMVDISGQPRQAASVVGAFDFP